MNGNRMLYAAAALMLAAAPATAQNTGGSLAEVQVTSGRPERGVYDENSVDRKARLVNRNQVYAAMFRAYPQIFDIIMRRQTTASIDVRMVVLEDGTVDPASVTVENTAEPTFAEAAIYVARQMRFRPALVGRQPVRVNVHMPVTFEIRVVHSRGESCYEISWCRNAQGWGSP